MSISELSIRRPVFAWMLMAALIVFGTISFFRMGISQLPDVDFPEVSVNIRLEGAAPEVIETEIVDVVENAVMGIEGVRSISSESENSEGTVTLEFDVGRDIDLAVQDVQAKVAQIQSRLPKDIGAPSIWKINPEDQPILLLTVQSDRYPLKYLMTFVRDRLRDRFATVPGVGDITLTGYLEPTLRAWVSESALNNFSLSVSDVINTIQSEHLEPPSGQVVDGPRVMNVRTMGEATSAEQFGNLMINQRGGQPNFRPIRLKEVVRVEEGLADVTRISRANRIPGVGLRIRKQRGANAVAVAREVKKRVAEVQKTLPDGVTLGVHFDSTKVIERSVGELNFTLVLSALLTGLVCWFFLGSWSSTFNVLLAIPTSVIGTFIALKFAGFTLNTFTLLGLSLSIGIVVDDSIMVLENIIRHQENGADKITAAIAGSREITFSALAATISIVAIFLPVAFMSGVIGRFFFQFGITISVAVLISLLEALTLTPMRCSRFVSVAERKSRFGQASEELFDRMAIRYQRSLAAVLRRPGWVVVFSMLAFLASLASLRLLNREFVPPEDLGLFNLRLKTPIGSSLSYSDAKFALAEKFLAARPEVEDFVLYVGGGSPGDSNFGQILVTMKEKGHRGVDPAKGHELSQAEFMALCRENLKIPDVRISIQDLSVKSFGVSRGYPVEFMVRGPEWDRMAKYAKDIGAELEKTGLVSDLDVDYEPGMPELRVLPDRDTAASRAVSVGDIGQTINAMIGGVLVGTYASGGHRSDIRLKLDDEQGKPLEALNRLMVRNNRGELVPLSSVVKFEQKSSLVSINRQDRERSITVYANVVAGKSQQAALDAVESIAKKMLPADYHVVLSGSSQSFGESFRSLMIALFLGLLVAYMVLASQFNSFIDPVTVLMALPFSVSGAFLALLATHQSLNVYSMIGLILLMGIVKKNSILLVDFTNQARGKEGRDSLTALLYACPIRLRPIVMTSVATIVGALPAAFAIGPGAESRVPMAMAIIGGVVVSTALTLYVVPAVYLLFGKMGGGKRKVAAMPAYSAPASAGPEINC